MKSMIVAVLLALASAVMSDLISSVTDLSSPILAALPDLQRAYDLAAGLVR